MKAGSQLGGRSIVCFAAIALLMSSHAAVAGAMGPGGYVGLGFGGSTMKDADTALIGVTTEDKDVAIKFFGGVMFNQYAGLEIGYVNFGRFTGVSPREDWSASGVDFSFVGALPFPDRYSNFSLFGKVGANAWTVDDDLHSFGVTTASGTSVTYGLGAQIEFNRDIGANIQWQRYRDVGDPTFTGRSDVDVATLNLVYHFRSAPDPYRHGHPRRRGYY